MAFICVVCQELLTHHPQSNQNILGDGSTTSSIYSPTNNNNTDVVATKCGHVFHLICLNNWFQKKQPVAKPECPQCRSCVLRKDMQKIFLSLDEDMEDLEARKNEVKELKQQNRTMKDEMTQLGLVLEDTGKQLETMTKAWNKLQLQYTDKVDEIATCRLEVKRLQDQMNNNFPVGGTGKPKDGGIVSSTLKAAVPGASVSLPKTRSASLGVGSPTVANIKKRSDLKAKPGLQSIQEISEDSKATPRSTLKRSYVVPRKTVVDPTPSRASSRVSVKSTSSLCLACSGSNSVAHTNSFKNYEVSTRNASATTSSRKIGSASEMNKKARKN